MNLTVFDQRPESRIKPLLEQLKTLWHYYPDHSLEELVGEVVEAANRITSDMPQVTYTEIEDITYPRSHCFYSRNLEAGIAFLLYMHRDEPLPITPIQTGILTNFEKQWRKNSQLRLGQLLALPTPLEELSGDFSRQESLI